ncbi:hypothetical protein I7I48_00021 [Histoplasma ohiense]|nr:hypothetical protein I7I48_00021 [Histoplasma ohiense (nom. inval.)]
MYVFRTSSFSFFSFLVISYTTLHYITTILLLLLSSLHYILSSTIHSSHCHHLSQFLNVVLSS